MHKMHTEVAVANQSIKTTIPQPGRKRLCIFAEPLLYPESGTTAAILFMLKSGFIWYKIDKKDFRKVGLPDDEKTGARAGVRAGV